MKPIVWTIAGSDSGGGAGIQADLQTFNIFNVHGCSVITAVTAQNSIQVCAPNFCSPDVVASQIEALKKDLPARAIKIGMIGCVESLKVIETFLKNYSGFVVLDPVLSSSTDTALSEQTYPQKLPALFPYVDLLTPNLPEIEKLLGYSIASAQEIEQAARQLLALGVKAVLIKGGHASGKLSQDYFTDGLESFWLSSSRMDNANTHGTGCVLSSAIAACVANHYSLKDALVIAKMTINQGIRQAVKIGQGVGPVALTCFPAEGLDLPRLTGTPEVPTFHFLSCGDKPLGLYPIVDRAQTIQSFIEAGITTVQLRVKDLTGEALSQEIQEAVALCDQYAMRLFVNDYWQLAIQHNAYGVHLGQEDLDTADLNAIEHAGLRLGISTHCFYEVARAHAIAPSYIACGPIYKTDSKPMAFGPQGLDALRYWCELLDYPVVGIGGIVGDRIEAVRDAGANGIAGISLVRETSIFGPS